MFVIVTAFLSIETRAQTNVVPDDVELQVLKNIYDSLGGSGWINKTNWPPAGNWPATATSAQFGTWGGITVSNGDIRTINLGYNNLTGLLPNSLSELKRLAFFYLQDNNISGPIPSSIGELTSLVNFYLGNNDLTGAIPPELGNLTSLQKLWLHGNNLSGSIPSSLWYLTELDDLRLAGNSLTGNISEDIGNLDKLKLLFLEFNQFTGNLPSSIVNLTELTQLVICANQFSGTLPENIGNLDKLTNFNCHTNQFTGSLPSSIGSMSALEIFNASGNDFTGIIPVSFSQLSNLWYFSVRENSLAGELPSLENWTLITQLYLYDNQLTGSFPDVGSCTALTTLNGHKNKFTSLPSSLLGLPVINSIHFENNDIGTIPDFSQHVNKANLSLYLRDNRLDFSQIETFVNKGLKLATYSVQKPFDDVTYLKVPIDGELIIPSRDAGVNGSYTWYFQADGTWGYAIVNAFNEDATQKTYKRSSAQAAQSGLYKYRMTNSTLSGVIESVPISVRVGSDVIWNEREGLQETSGIITKTASSGWGNAKTISENALLPNTDGWFEFAIDQTNSTSNFAVGFSQTSDNARVSLAYGIGISTQGGQKYFIHESSEEGIETGTWVPGDIFKIERTGSTIKYFKNGYQIKSISTNANAEYKIKMLQHDGNVPVTSSSFWIHPSNGVVPDLWEFAALKDLYDSLRGSSWSTATNWPTTGNWPASTSHEQFGTWARVVVENGDVVNMGLNFSGLLGKLPSSIENFQSLRRLILSGGITSFPTSINKLAKLTEFQFLAVIQPNLTSFPDLSGLLELEILSFRCIGPRIVAPGPIPTWIGALKKLKVLQIVGMNRTSIPEELGDIDSLQTLVITDPITGNLPSSIGNLSKLKTLRITGTQITGGLPPSFNNLSNLETAELNNNKLTGKLVFAENSLGKLKTLNLQNNLLTEFPEFPESMDALTTLNLGSNSILGPIHESIGNLSGLQFLTLVTNQITSVPESIGNLGNLIVLDLDHNRVVSPVVFPENSFGAIKTLDLSYNLLTSFPEFSESMNTLTHLELTHNFSLIGPISESIGNLTGLESLILRINNISGPLPASISQLQNLVTLDLAHNEISGLPESIGLLQNLRVFRVNNNNIETLPSSIGQLGNLTELLASYNVLTSIPDSWNMVNLQQLDLSDNGLLAPGPIPSLQNSTKLVYLNLNNTNRTGSIPEWLGQLPALTQLNLNNNNLTGSIPMSIGSSTISSLDLSFNKITGSIPESFADASPYLDIDVSYNQLSGEIPDIFDNWTYSAYINFSNNQLTGIVPASLGSVGSAQRGLWATLDLSSNKLTSVSSGFWNILSDWGYILLDNNLISTLPIPPPTSAYHELSLTYNMIDFSTVENLTENQVYFYYQPQKNINDIKKVNLVIGSPLVINARDPGQFSTIIWEKQEGSSWVIINASNEDATQQTFTRNSATLADQGVYRWRMTNTTLPDVTIQSDPITVYPANNEPIKKLYNGLITAAHWRTNKASGHTDDLSGMYYYTYDDKYQIADASWADDVNRTIGTFTRADNKFRTTGMTYDPNGNILSLKRFDQSGSFKNNLTYHYAYQLAGSTDVRNNQLLSVDGYVSAFTYNKIGQMIGQDKETGFGSGDDNLNDKDQYVEYDASGKVTRVFDGKNEATGTFEGLKVEYLYDDRGFRLAKVNFETERTTWYIRDASGSIISTYEEDGIPTYNSEGVPVESTNTLELTEVPVYGSGKLGVHYPGQNGSTVYEITDHLGNVRALMRDNANTYTATMEDTEEADFTNPRVEEMQYFENLFKTEDDNVYMNHTPPRPGVEETPDKSAYLHWVEGMAGMEASDKSIGPAIALRVSPGDKLDLKTWVRFERKEGPYNDIPLTVLTSLLGNTFAGIGGFEGYISSQVSSNMYGQLLNLNFLNDDSDPAMPRAYLNYFIYDDEMELLFADRQQVEDDAGFYNEEMGLLNGENYSQLGFPEPIAIEQKGYIYIWVSNESENTKVWFDDLTVTHTGSFVTQAMDYGVWGDVLREQKTAESKYRFGYQGQFAEKDDETGWNHFELREYDPVIGKWLVPDPYDQYWSPYVGIGNDPVNVVDPNGAYTMLVAFFKAIRAGENPFHIYKDKDTDEWGYNSSSLESNDIFGITPTIVVIPDFGDEKKKAMINSWQPNFLDRWGESDNLTGSFTYSFVDKFYVAGHFFTPWSTPTHLDGQPADSRDRVDAFTSSAASVIPFARLTPKMSASDFSSFTKGTFLARLPGKSRSAVMKQANRFTRSPMKYPKRIETALTWLGSWLNTVNED